MITVTTENWQARANCRDVTPETMQPEVATTRDVHAAKLICNGCPVLAQCKALAESQLGAYGIHAGEWYGPFPRTVGALCEWCGDEIPDPDGANRATRRFCGDNCRKRAKRARQAAERIAS